MATLACCVSLLVALLAFVVASSMATRRALLWVRRRLEGMQEFAASRFAHLIRRPAMPKNTGGPPSQP
jgi:hypothetical protein